MRTKVLRTMRNHLIRATLLGAVVVLGSAGAAHALTVGAPVGPPTTVRTDSWTTETGQSMPTGTAGFVDGTLVANVAGFYTFTYGGGGLVAGDTGHGNSAFVNEFWVGPTPPGESGPGSAEALGHVFCTQAEPSCGGVATTVGQSFTMFLPAGPIPFCFEFGPTNTNALCNGQVNDALGAYLAQIGLGTTANAGPGGVGYLGLSDNTYGPTLDHDFQDLVVRVAQTPEPASLLLLGVGLIGVAFYARRRKNLAA